MEGFAQQTAVGVRVGAHPAISGGREFLQLRDEPAVSVEQLLRLIVTHPGFKNLEVLGVFSDSGDWNLVRPPGALQLVPIQLLGSCPAFGTTQDYHGPARPVRLAVAASLLLNGADLIDARFYGSSHFPVH